MKGKSLIGTAMLLLILLSSCIPAVEGGEAGDVDEKNKAEIIDVGDPDSIRVLYTVSGFVFTDAFTGDKDEVEERLFHHLDFGDDYITFLGKQCIGVTFEEETVDATQYLRDAWGQTPESLRIKGIEELNVIRTNCPLFGFQEYMRIGKQLVVPYEGVFYFFDPFLTY